MPAPGRGPGRQYRRHGRRHPAPSNGFVGLSLTGNNDNVNATGDLDLQTSATSGALSIVGLGNGAGISAPSLDRTFDNRAVGPGAVTISNIGFSNGNPEGSAGLDGGTIRVLPGGGALTLDGVGFSTSGADNNGGVVDMQSVAALTVTNSSFGVSGAGILGGAIHAMGPVSVTGSTFNGIGTTNGKPGSGGAIALEGNFSHTIDRSSFVDGRALFRGAAIFVKAGSLDVRNTAIGENQGDQSASPTVAP